MHTQWCAKKQQIIFLCGGYGGMNLLMHRCRERVSTKHSTPAPIFLLRERERNDAIQGVGKTKGRTKGIKTHTTPPTIPPLHYPGPVYEAVSETTSASVC